MLSVAMLVGAGECRNIRLDDTPTSVATEKSMGDQILLAFTI